MGRKSKYSFETKLSVVLRYFSGKTSPAKEAETPGTDVSAINHWVRNYQSLGEEGLQNIAKNKSYSAEFKTLVAEEYLSGSTSLCGLCKEYGIPSKSIMRHHKTKNRKLVRHPQAEMLRLMSHLLQQCR